MEDEVKLEREWLWVGLPTELDHYQAERLREKIREKLQASCVRYIIFDFEHTQLMDSSGIGLIAGRYRELAARGGRVYVSHVGAGMRKVLTLSGLYRIVLPWGEEAEKPVGK